MSPEEFAVLVGLIMPPVIAFIRGSNFSRTIATLLSMVVALIVGTAGAVVTGDIVLSEISLDDLETIGPAAAAAFASATIFYNVWFKDTEANAVLQQRSVPTPAAFLTRTADGAPEIYPKG